MSSVGLGQPNFFLLVNLRPDPTQPLHFGVVQVVQVVELFEYPTKSILTYIFKIKMLFCYVLRVYYSIIVKCSKYVHLLLINLKFNFLNPNFIKVG